MMGSNSQIHCYSHDKFEGYMKLGLNKDLYSSDQHLFCQILPSVPELSTTFAINIDNNSFSILMLYLNEANL